MIKSITMKKCASYDQDGVLVDACDKVNLIYGYNGSGKTTISNFLANPQDERFADCSLAWETGTQTDILVYNKEFRERNIQATDMPGVFTLGEDASSQLAELKRLNEEKERRIKERRDYSIQLERKEREYGELLKDYEDTVWEQIFRRNDNVFKDAFTGMRNRKVAFFQKVREVYQEGAKTDKKRREIEERAETLFGQRPERQPTILTLPFEDAGKIESNEIWQKVIVGNKDVSISGLIDTLNMSDWVKDGQAYIQSNGICPFCQNKTITETLRSQFDAYFSGEYERQVTMVTALQKQYAEFTDNIAVKMESVIYAIKGLRFDFNSSQLESRISDYLALLNRNATTISLKRAEPSRKVELKSSVETADEIAEIIANINEKITLHNRMVDNYKEERDRLVADIWGLLIVESKDTLAAYEGRVLGTEKAIKSITTSLKRADELISDLDKQIAEVNKDVTGVKHTVDAINRSLKIYGFEGFSIKEASEDSNRYQIKRPNGDSAAETLSEGEETFITFLYFMYLTQGGLNREAISQHKVVVIDDPICSLDSSILFVVSSMMRRMIDDVKKGVGNIDQIFVLTHNVYFHKEISFIDGRNKIDGKTKFWLLKKRNEISSCTAYERVNPIKTAYALLWSEVKEDSNASTISLQNAMRRILENFFGTLGNADSWTIIQCFDTAEERSICRSLFSWVNDGSHSIPDDLEFSENTDAQDKYRKVFKEIFYKTHNEYHYERMME